jgi:RNA exonuclease 4
VHPESNRAIQVMGLKHPANRTRDVALFLPFRKTLRAKQVVPLPQLMQAFMNRRINASFEDPVCITAVSALQRLI